MLKFEIYLMKILDAVGVWKLFFIMVWCDQIEAVLYHKSKVYALRLRIVKGILQNNKSSLKSKLELGRIVLRLYKLFA